MFNSSNLTSSITGWFSNLSPKNEEEPQQANTTQNEKSENINSKPVEEDVKKDIETPEKQPAGEKKAAAANKGEEDDTVPENKEDENTTGNTDETSSGKLHIDMTPEEVQQKLTEETKKMMESAKSFGSYLFGVATVASRKVSDKVTETASTLKNTIEEKTIIGDLNREQEEFLKEKRQKQGDAPLPPWVGYQEEEAMKQQIMTLSMDKRNFLRNPPSGVQFQFDFDHSFPIAMATLKEDENLKKMRFDLVPKQLKEDIFWRNYFYRVSLIKQSAQLSTLADMQHTKDPQSSSSSTSSAVIIGSTANGTTLSRSSSAKSLNNRSDPESSTTAGLQPSTTGPDVDENLLSDGLTNTGGGQEFISDDFDPSALNPDDLEQELKQLGMEDGGEIPEWEQELQKELQDYEVVNDGTHKDEGWEKEIEDMLNDEASK